MITPALPGRGDIAGDRFWIGHGDNVAAVLAALDADAAGPVVLAGHSLGGTVISQVADQRLGRIARLVYCAEFVLEDGESADEVMPDQMRAAITQLAATRADRAIPMPWELWRAKLHPDRRRAAGPGKLPAANPEPYRPVFEPIRLRRPVHRELPASYLAFTHDQTMPPGFWHPGMSGRLNGATVTEIDGDHEMPLTAPERLADALHHAATAPG